MESDHNVYPDYPDGHAPSNVRPKSQPRPISPLSSFSQNPLHPATAVTPVKFAATTNAFHLAVSPTSSTSSGPGTQLGSILLNNERSPPQASSTARRMRRPSMLSLSARPTYDLDDGMTESREDTEDELETAMASVQGGSKSPNTSPTNTKSYNPFGSASRWGSRDSSMFSASPTGRPAGPPSMQSLTTNSPPSIPSDMDQENGDNENMLTDPEDLRSPLRFLPSHLDTSASRRKGKGKLIENDTPVPPRPAAALETAIPGGLISRKPLPATLLATLISETAPQEHEMQSEARMQRFMHSHASRLPFTPRVSKSTRGRFPEMADNEDDDNDLPARRPSYRDRTSWTNMRMDSDSESDQDEDLGEPVNAAFAAGMDLDRPMSSTSSAIGFSGNGSESGKMTPGSGPLAITGSRNGSGSGSTSAGVPTPPPQNSAWGARPARMSFSNQIMSSPGTGLALPGAFGSLGMGGGTPLGSPTLERLELGTSPGANSASSPGLMQYRESLGGSASMRPGKRKAQPDDRFDPYKRPRGTSPSFTPMSPSRPLSSIPTSPFAASNTNRRPYRPLSSRSRQASPALSIGSTSGVLGTSLGSNTNKSLGGNFIPTGPAAALAAQQGQAPQLGGLGLLSLANVGEDAEGEVRANSEDIEGHDRRRSENDMEED